MLIVMFGSKSCRVLWIQNWWFWPKKLKSSKRNCWMVVFSRVTLRLWILQVQVQRMISLKVVCLSWWSCHFWKISYDFSLIGLTLLIVDRYHACGCYKLSHFQVWLQVSLLERDYFRERWLNNKSAEISSSDLCSTYFSDQVIWLFQQPSHRPQN